MNERIKELEAQATVWHCRQGLDVSWLDTEKFAELIVKECISKIEQNGQFIANYPVQNQTSADRVACYANMAAELKIHFRS